MNRPTSAAPPQWNVDFDRAPFLVIWETTQACELACRHCRAEAMPGPIPGELTTDEGFRLIDQVADLGTPLLVLSGGDPASRHDLPQLVRHAKARGLRVATVPAATPRLTRDFIRSMKDAGLDQVAFSLDFPQAALHDAFRGVPGAFERTLEAVAWAKEAGLPHQINTCVWGDSARHLQEMADLVERLEVVFWEVFFLVPTGRGLALRGLTPRDCDKAFAILARAQARKKYILKVTEAPHYRRWLRQHDDREVGRVQHHPGHQPGIAALAHRGVNAGNGFLFVSHYGQVFPSGFLPVNAGSVRQERLADIYRESPVFKALRDPALLKGRCASCPFKVMCGGSRSRAFALGGDWLGEDPWCDYETGPGQAGDLGPIAAVAPRQAAPGS